MNYQGKALTIAGSDSGGGAGIQADLKTFAAFNVFGMSAITSITAQNTTGVRAIHDLPLEIIRQQIDAVMEDIGAEAVKTGMLSNSDIVRLVASLVKKYGINRLVVDPVMVAKGGSPLLDEPARQTLRDELLPLAYLVTPNVFEAEIISGLSIKSVKDAEKAARAIQDTGADNILLKGGHLPTERAIDILFNGDKYYHYESERIATRNTHGTGCTLSAAITAGLAQGQPLLQAVETAKDYVYRAISSAPDNIGRGHGPLYHNTTPRR